MNKTIKKNIENRLKEKYSYVEFRTELQGCQFVFMVGATVEKAELRVYNAEGFEVQMLVELSL